MIHQKEVISRASQVSVLEVKIQETGDTKQVGERSDFARSLRIHNWFFLDLNNASVNAMAPALPWIRMKVRYIEGKSSIAIQAKPQSTCFRTQKLPWRIVGVNDRKNVCCPARKLI